MSASELAAPVLEAVDLHKHFHVSHGWLRRPATVRALDGVSLRLSAGRTLAVVGESGCGKSTLARCVALIEPLTAGQVRYDGGDPRQDKSLRKNLQMVFQNPVESLNPRKTVGAALVEPLVINTREPAASWRTAALAMLDRVGLGADFYHRYPHMLSGGQRQRVAIARALMLNPRVVVCDEPVSALDVSIQAQALNLLLDLQDRFGVAYLFISHDLNVVRHIADEVMVMYFGRVVEQAPRDALFARPRHPYTRLLLAAAPRLSLDAAPRLDRGRRTVVLPTAMVSEPPSPLTPPAGCAFQGRCPLASSRCGTEAPALRPLDGGLVACHHAEDAG